MHVHTFTRSHVHTFTRSHVCPNHLIIKLMLTTVLVFATTVQAKESGLPLYIPDGVNIWEPPSPVGDERIVFVEKNEQGESLRLKFSRSEEGKLELSREKIPEQEMQKLGERFHVIQEDTDASIIQDLLARGIIAQAKSSSSCPAPGVFSVVGDSNGEAVGGFDLHNTNKPIGAETQWVVFDFYTKRYRTAQVHMPIVLRHEDLVHGWDAFIGDNSDSPEGCTGQKFTTQIEGWVIYTPDPLQYPNFDVDDESTHPPSGPMWQSNVYQSSCGSDLIDGWVPIGPGVGFPRYRMIIHASSGYWVAYQVQEWISGSGWSIVTSWTDVDTSLPEVVGGISNHWDFPPPPYNNAAEGITVFATDSGNHKPYWSVNISNFQCGWF